MARITFDRAAVHAHVGGFDLRRYKGMYRFRSTTGTNQQWYIYPTLDSAWAALRPRMEQARKDRIRANALPPRI